MTEQIMKPLDMAIRKVELVQKKADQYKIAPMLLIPFGFIAMFIFDYLSNSIASQTGISGFFDFISFGQKVKIEGTEEFKRIGSVTWFMDPFLASQFILLAWGQYKALTSLANVKHGADKVFEVITALKGIPAKTSIQAMKEVISKQRGGHLKDIITRWFDLGSQGETSQFQSMMDNAAMRRAEVVDKDVSDHVSFNRTMLKLGFIGTLIGLAMTFPPMKEAIQSLNIAGQEGSFVGKIANAIDGDAYAILTTLVATAFSVFIELLTIQMFKRLYGSFEMVNNFVDEWCLVEFIPWINELKVGNEDMDKELAMQRKFQEEMLSLKKQFLDEMITLQKQQSTAMQQFQKDMVQNFSEVQNDLSNKVVAFQTETTGKISANQNKIVEMQGSVDKNIVTLAQSVGQSGQQAEKLIPLQKAFGERVEELAAYERQYRSFLQAQGNVNIPSHLKPGV